MKNNWQTKKLGDFVYVTDFVANGSFASLRENVKYLDEPGYAILVRLKDFTKGWNNNYVYVSKNSYDFLKKSSLIAGDLVMSNVGEPGKVFVVPDLKMPMTLGPNSILIRPNTSEMQTEFLNYYFQSEQGQNQINSITSGTTQKKFNKTSFRLLSIPEPLLAEQKRIVKVLDEVFEKIEKAKENTEKNLQNSHELFESYSRQLFSNQNWANKNLEEIAENLDSKRVPVTKRDRVDGKYPYYGASGAVDSVNNYLFDEDLLLVSEDGANLLARTYPIAFSISGKSWVNNHAHVLRFNKKESQKFVEYFLNSINLESYVSGMAQPKLNQKALNSIKVPFPEFERQKEEVNKLDKLSEQTKKLEEIYRQKLADLEELKKSILQKAFAGELVN